MNEWKTMLKQLKLEHIRRTAPAFFQASGSYSMQVKPYSDRTNIGLTRCITDYLRYSGYHLVDRKSNRRQSFKWRKSPSQSNPEEIEAVIHGRALRIQIRIGDEPVSGQQLREKLKAESTGGLFYVARDFQSFLHWFETVFSTTQKV